MQGNDFAFGVLDNRSVRGFDRMMPAFGDAKCLHLYYYFMERECGLVHVQVPGARCECMSSRKGVVASDRERLYPMTAFHQLADQLRHGIATSEACSAQQVQEP